MRQAGSAAVAPRRDAGRPAAGSNSFTPTQATASTANTSSAMMPWCSSAARNAATSVGLLLFRPEFIPGIAVHPSSAGWSWRHPGSRGGAACADTDLIARSRTESTAALCASSLCNA